MDPNIVRLRRYLETRVPPVLIFTGEPGSGRKELAYEFVKWANCKPQYLEVYKAAELMSVDKARSLASTRKLVPEGEVRFVVMEDLDNSSTSAWNALLKMLEQPPARTHFILLASGRGVPTTIQSRGVVFYFGTVEDSVLLENIEKEARTKLVWSKLSPFDRELLLAVSEGAWGRLRGILTNDGALKMLLAMVHNFTVAKVKTEFFKQIRDYTELEKDGVLPLESVFRVLLEAVKDNKPLVYAKRITRNLKGLNVDESLKMLGRVQRMWYQRDRIYEYLYMTTR